MVVVTRGGGGGGGGRGLPAASRSGPETGRTPRGSRQLLVFPLLFFFFSRDVVIRGFLKFSMT